MKKDPATVEIGFFDSGFFPALSNRRTDLGRRFDIVLADHAQILLHRRCRSEGHAPHIVDQLSTDVFVRPINAQAHPSGIHLAKLVPNAQAAFQKQGPFAVCHISRPYFFLPSLRKMNSPL